MIKMLKEARDFYFYGYSAKLSIVCAVLFFVVGYVLSYVGTMGIFFLMTSSIWLVQTFLTLPVANIVKSSPKRKQLETSLPAVVGLVGSVVIYILFAFFVLVRNGKGYMQEEQMASYMLQAGFFAMITLMYCGAAYKFMMISTIIYFMMAMFVLNGFLHGYLEGMFAGISFSVGIIIGLVEILTGALLQYALSRLLYQYPMTKHAQYSKLSKLM